ncbi:MAG: hypothetical protein PVH88_23315 [Ignavibacteria bacterium]|jgi:hypothetical protein
MKQLIRITFVFIIVFSISGAQDKFNSESVFASTETTNGAKPIQLALINPIQLFPETTPIVGLRFNLLYGKNTTVSGLDIGFVNHTTAGTTKGWQFGLVGFSEANFLGFQDNAVNATKGKMEGFQFGVFNYAGTMSGFQLGFVNYAQSLYGLQVGILNFIQTGGQFPVFPIVNWSF